MSDPELTRDDLGRPDNHPEQEVSDPGRTSGAVAGAGAAARRFARIARDAADPRRGTGPVLTARYARSQRVHLAVVAALAAYPWVYGALLSSPVAAEADALLPDVETMVAVLYFGLFAMSFDFVSGYTGYLSFGHAAFYGAGAYFVVLVANGKVPPLPSGTPFVVSLVLGGLLAAGLALLIGAVSFRLTGVYFAMITLGFSQVLYVFARGWDYVGSNPRDGPAVVGHPAGFEIGVPGVDGLSVAIGKLAGDEVTNLLGLGVDLSTVEVSYYAVGVVVLVCYFAMQRVVHSPFGRVMVAIRENEERARAVGYDTLRYKLAAFAMSAFFAGIAGGLFAGYRRSVTPENSLYFLVTGDALLAAIIGGFGTLAGPLYGRLFDAGVREFLSKAGAGGGLLPYLRAHVPADVLATPLPGGVTVGRAIEAFLNGHASLYVGALFVAVVLFVPGGMLGALRARLGGPAADRLPGAVARRVRPVVERAAPLSDWTGAAIRPLRDRFRAAAGRLRDRIAAALRGLRHRGAAAVRRLRDRFGGRR